MPHQSRRLLNELNVITPQTSSTMSKAQHDKPYRNNLQSASKSHTMLFTILIYLVYYMVYTILLAIAGLWCFEECVLTEEEEYDFVTHHRALPY
ncbi:hypothetical protein RR46_11239 [Papilio xuthus]|uniref:Uncharacterized protein n=1 Tax=Papilio xuthus TaxID=66420 RepID=A0A194PYL5_PAPXU|nr:hypothetical protein RR46_11239 [Papilio xuthus]